MPAQPSSTLLQHHTFRLHQILIHQIHLCHHQACSPAQLCQQHQLPLPATIQRSKARRQWDYIAGRLAAKYAMQAYGYHNFSVKTGLHGQPLFPHALQGSISHSSDQHSSMAISAVHANQHQPIYIGLDIERQQHQHLITNHNTNISVFIHPLEKQQLDTHGLVTPVQLLLLFSAKESIIKAWFSKYQQLLPFHAIHYQQSEPSCLYFHIQASAYAVTQHNVTVYFGYTAHELITLACI